MLNCQKGQDIDTRADSAKRAIKQNPESIRIIDNLVTSWYKACSEGNEDVKAAAKAEILRIKRTGVLKTTTSGVAAGGSKKKRFSKKNRSKKMKKSRRNKSLFW